MIGAIAGDIIGAPYEFDQIKKVDFEPLFHPLSFATDDSVLTLATAECMMTGAGYAETYRRYYRGYPHRGYGSGFSKWARSRRKGPYNSLGNGSAMRVSPLGYYRRRKALTEARKSAMVTHSHPEGVKGAVVTAGCVYMARFKYEKRQIAGFATKMGYDLTEPVDSIREWYRFDETCPGTVPPAIQCFLEAKDYEHAVRLAVSLGGDSDTLACITGAIAGAYFGVPAWIEREVLWRLDAPLVDTLLYWERMYG